MWLCCWRFPSNEEARCKWLSAVGLTEIVCQCPFVTTVAVFLSHRLAVTVTTHANGTVSQWSTTFLQEIFIFQLLSISQVPRFLNFIEWLQAWDWHLFHRLLSTAMSEHSCSQWFWYSRMIVRRRCFSGSVSVLVISFLASASLGHCAKYTVMELRQNRVIDIQLVQSNEVHGSINMPYSSSVCKHNIFVSIAQQYCQLI